MNRNKTTLYNIASTVILQGLTFLSGPIFSSVLGTDNYGITSVYLTWVQLASTVFSLQAAGTIVNARVNFPEEEQEKYQSSVISLATLCYSAFSICTLAFCVVFQNKLGINILMVLFGLMQGWGSYCVTTMNSKFTYEFKANKNFLLSVITAFCTIGFSILLIYVFPSETNYWGRIIGQSFVYFLLGIIVFIYITKKGKTFYNRIYWKYSLPIAIPTVFHLLAMIVLNQSDKIMLQNMVSNSAVGIYSLSCTFSAVLSTIYNALNNSWVPYFYEYMRQGKKDEIRKHSRNYIELFTIISMGFVLLFREVFHVYADSRFWEGTDFIPIFSIGTYFVFIYSFSVNYEFYNRKTKTIAIGTICAAVLNIILNYLFILLWGTLGAVIATAISHGFQFCFHFLFARKIKKEEFPFMMKDFICPLILLCCIVAFYYYTSELWMIRWMLGASLGLYEMIKILKRKEIF